MRRFILVCALASCGPPGLGGENPDGGGHLAPPDAGEWMGDPKTCAHAAQTRTYVGCDFWPTVMPNVVKAYFDFAVVVANAGDTAADVTIERGGQPVAGGQVAPNALGKFYLPWVPELKHYTALCDTAPTQPVPPLDASKRVPDGAYHLTSSVPVTVYQFNPLEYKGGGGPPGKSWAGCDQCWPGCNSYTNDASLLLPSTALTASYVTTTQSGIDTAEIRAPGYVSVTGLRAGTTVDVKVGPRGALLAGGGVPAAGAGQVVSFPIDRGEVVLLLGTPDTDLGGTLVHADQPVQVMTGHPQIYLPFDRQSSDHLEEIVFPVETLGRHYFVARPTGPRGGAVPQSVRLFGVQDGTSLSYPSGTPPGAPLALARGQVVDLGVIDLDFELSGDHEFEVATYQLGQTIVDPAIAGKGDPSQSTVASVEQYRTKFVFLAPDDYDVSYADVTMPMGAHVSMDGAPISATPTAIGGGYGVARVTLAAGNGGAHLLESDVEVGLQVMGYGFATSYQYPGGLNLKGIAPPLPDVY